MTLLAPWLAFPVVLGVLSLGCGLLTQEIAGISLPRPLVLPTGLATIVTVSCLTVALPATARLTTPLVAALAAAGLVLSRARRPDWWAFGAAAVAFLCYGAPVLVSGAATFAGYIKLDDTATFLALTDRILAHGRSVAGLPPSTYEATLSLNLARGYPLGSLTPLAIGRELLRTDAAWLYQPWLSYCGAMLALALYALAAPLVTSRPLRALVAIVAAQPALLYGYALWGGVKELAGAALIATAAALTVTIQPLRGARALLPFAVASVAVLETLSGAGVVWLLPLAVPILAVAVRRLAAAAIATAVVVVLALPVIASSSDFLGRSNRATFENSSELGNLVHPLRPLQVVGVWPNGDFRLDPTHRGVTAILIALTVAAALAGAVLAYRQRARAMLLALAAVLLAVVVFEVLTGPWFTAKALALSSPLVLVAALAGCVGLLANVVSLGRPASRAALVLGLVALVAVTGGVAWSNVLAYHDVDLAPHSQLVELERIGDRFARDGPALMTEYQPYGVRHFLRRLAPEGVSELRRRRIPLRDGRLAAKGEYVDLDQLQLAGLLVYRTFVLRRSPTESRPPAPYRLVWHGRWYDVWQRPPVATVLAHLPLGGPLQPAARASCAAIELTTRIGTVAAPPRPLNRIWALDSGSLPGGWTPLSAGAVLPARSGTSIVRLVLPEGGRYRVWVGGSVRGRLTASVDGRKTGSVSSQLQNAGQWLDLGPIAVRGGPHLVTLALGLSRWRPGTGGSGFPLGPLLLQPQSRAQVSEPRDPRRLCGRTLDWVEALPR